MDRFTSNSLAGWQIYDGDLSNPGTGGNTRGRDDGYLLAENWTDGYTGYYMAPDRYHGDWTKYDALQFDLKSEGQQGFMSFGCSDARHCDGDIVINNGRDRAIYRFKKRPPKNWERYTISLHDDDDEWKIEPQTKSLSDILKNVNYFEIRSEYAYGPTFMDTAGLDNVVFIQGELESGPSSWPRSWLYLVCVPLTCLGLIVLVAGIRRAFA